MKNYIPKFFVLHFILLVFSQNLLAHEHPDGLTCGEAEKGSAKLKNAVEKGLKTIDKYCLEKSGGGSNGLKKSREAVEKEFKACVGEPPIKSSKALQTSLQGYFQKAASLCESSHKSAEISESICKNLTNAQNNAEALKKIADGDSAEAEKMIETVAKGQEEVAVQLGEANQRIQIQTHEITETLGVPESKDSVNRKTKYKDTWDSGRRTQAEIRKAIQEMNVENRNLGKKECLNRECLNELKSKRKDLQTRAKSCAKLLSKAEAVEWELYEYVIKPTKKIAEANKEVMAKNKSKISQLLSNQNKIDGRKKALSSENEKIEKGATEPEKEKEKEDAKVEHPADIAEKVTKDREDALKPLEGEEADKAKYDVVDYSERKRVAAAKPKAGVKPVKGVIVHQTSDKIDRKTGRLLDTTQGKKSARYGTHYFIDPDGTIVKAAPLDERTLHIREGQGAGRGLNNSNTIGIELVGYEGSEPTDAQYSAMRQISSEINTYAAESNPSLADSRPLWINHSQINPHKDRREGADLSRIFEDAPQFRPKRN